MTGSPGYGRQAVAPETVVRQSPVEGGNQTSGQELGSGSADSDGKDSSIEGKARFKFIPTSVIVGTN